MSIPAALLDAAAAGVLYDGSCAQHEAALLLAELALDPEQADPLPSLREVEEAIAEHVAAIREGIADLRYLQFEWETTRGVRA